MENEVPELVAFQVRAGDCITIIDWRTDLLIRVMVDEEPSWCPIREAWIFPYAGGPEVPGYAIWVENHWEDGEY